MTPMHDLTALKLDLLARLPTQLNTVLYVGTQVERRRKPSLLVALKRRSIAVDGLEAWLPNVEETRKRFPKRFRKISWGKIQNWDCRGYDLVFFWHGPEHLHRDETFALCQSLPLVVRYVVLACPWGMTKQGALYGNPYEEHKSEYEPAHFEAFGYTVTTIGRRNVKGSTLVATKGLL